MTAVLPDQVFAELALGGVALRVVGYLPWHEGRARVESFIARRFRQAHGACIHSFLPTLITLETVAGDIQAAIGVRSAHSEKLFLEQYLNQPIEAAIGQESQSRCRRRDVIEVGNLAGGSRGISRCFFAVLSAVLQDWGARWLACTGTTEVVNVFHRLGISPLSLAPADPACLADAGADWGSYYAHRPVVMVGDIAQGLGRVRQSGLLQRCAYQRVEVNHVLIA